MSAARPPGSITKKVTNVMVRNEDESMDPRTVSGRRRLLTGLAALPVLAACSPTVKIEAPAEPIEINVNVRIEQEVRVKIDRELDTLFEEDDDIF